MEMQLFLRESLRLITFYHMSNTDRHLLTLVEELKNDGKEEVVCMECMEPAVVGPTLKCTACQWLKHLSCFKFKTSTLYFHFGRRHDDQLIFTEELKNDGCKEGVVCMVCDEQVEGPGYKCSASECNFRLHESCAQLPRQIPHPSHPTHILILHSPRVNLGNCNACGKWCCTSLFYRCKECNFNLDIPCATRTRIDNTHDCQHTFVPLFKQIHFTCEACGQEDTDFASLCTICQLFIHTKCAGLPRTIYISRHNHSLTLIYSLHNQVKDFNNVFCNLCGQKVKTKYAAFCCQECGFVAHLYCTEEYRVRSAEHELLYEKFVDAMEKINPGEIQLYFSHPHNLILSHEEVLHDKLCDGCMHFIISTPFYKCTQCNFFLHTTCAQLPKKKNHVLHKHTLTLLPHAPYAGGLFSCKACGHSRHGFIYRCDPCKFHLDVQCCSISKTLKHEGHQHSLFLPVSSKKKCNACDHDHKHSKVFVCTACDFALGFECATLPLIVRHKYDEHLLALTYITEDNSEEYYCLICEEKKDPKHWFYYCAKCDFPAHPHCVLGKYPYIKFGTTFKSRVHRHSVTFVQKTEYSPPCDACGKTLDGMALECTQCKFNVHYWNNLVCVQKISNEVLRLHR